jgi:flavin reductase (DIM6/NTAB) family NADH-FMN oxidoreductase RutF
MDIRDLRNCLGKFATGVTVVTWNSENQQKQGITVNSFTSVSLDPPLVLVSIDKKAKANERMHGKPFVINILSSGQEAIAWQFAGKEQLGLQIDWEESNYGPKIQGSLATIECKPWKEYDGGDHVLYVGEVKNYHYEEGNALVFFQGKFLETNSIDNYVKK